MSKVISSAHSGWSCGPKEKSLHESMWKECLAANMQTWIKPNQSWQTWTIPTTENHLRGILTEYEGQWRHQCAQISVVRFNPCPHPHQFTVWLGTRCSLEFYINISPNMAFCLFSQFYCQRRWVLVCSSVCCCWIGKSGDFYALSTSFLHLTFLPQAKWRVSLAWKRNFSLFVIDLME